MHDNQPVTSTRSEGGMIFPLRFDGEPVTDPAFALQLPADFRPWEQVVQAYLDEHATPLRRAA